MEHQTGQCYCGNITLELNLPNSISTYTPRECDCSFCQKHGAAWLSDPHGKLLITINHPENLLRFHQGSRQAEFLICQSCGVLAAVCYSENTTNYTAINYRALQNKNQPGNPVTVSPQKLSAEEKTSRWKEVWFSNTKILTNGRRISL